MPSSDVLATSRSRYGFFGINHVVLPRPRISIAPCIAGAPSVSVSVMVPATYTSFETMSAPDAVVMLTVGKRAVPGAMVTGGGVTTTSVGSLLLPQALTRIMLASASSVVRVR